MRYSIIGSTIQQVRSVGGTDIKEARYTKIIFANLSVEEVVRLRIKGCLLEKIGKVKTEVMPPTPVAAAPTYSPEQLLWAAGLDEMRTITEPPLYGSGFNLAIIDSGVRETHQKINHRIIYSKNFTSSLMEDTYNHGTGVASIALTVAPLCGILNLKVLNDKGEGTEEEVVLAIDECISLIGTEYAPTIINLSLGSPDDGNPNNILRVACRAAIDRGIWVVASAGNSGPINYSITCPATEKYVGAIGSAKYFEAEGAFIISNWSSRGPTLEGLIKPDLVLFGEDIIVASSDSDVATIAKSGTSFSTPFASGMAICYHEGMLRGAVPTIPIAGLAPEITWLVPIEDIIDIYLSRVCIKPEGVVISKDNEYGYGLPFGPLIAQALVAKPAVDVSAILTPVMLIAMLGMVIIPMTKGLE